MRDYICVVEKTMFLRILGRSLSPVVQVPRHRTRVIYSIGEIICRKGPRTNLQPFLPQIRKLILAEQGASYSVTSRLLGITRTFFRGDDAVRDAVRSLVATLARENKKVHLSRHRACSFISDCGKLKGPLPVSTCDYLSTILMDAKKESRNATLCLKWISVLNTFARASYDPVAPVITYIVKEIVEKLVEPGGFSYSSSTATKIAKCVAMYPTPSFIEAVRKVVTPHVVREKNYRIMEKLFDSGCLTAEDVRAVGLHNLFGRQYHSPLLCKMIMKDVELATEWILWKSKLVTTKESKETMVACVSLVLATDPRAVTLLQGLTSILALSCVRFVSKDRISLYCEVMLGELAGRSVNVCSRKEILRVCSLSMRNFLRRAERRMFHKRIGAPLVRLYFLRGDFSEMTAYQLVGMFKSVQTYPKMFGKPELRLVLNRLWELQTRGEFISQVRPGAAMLMSCLWRSVVRTGLRRTPLFDALLAWSLSTNIGPNRLAEALAIVSVPHKHGAYRSVEVAAMRTLFQRVAPQGLTAYGVQLILVAAARVGLRDTQLLEALARRALICVPYMVTARSVASVVWALCRLRLMVPALLEALVVRLHAIEGGVTSHGKHVVASLKSLT